jgi:hypothetical protein
LYEVSREIWYAYNIIWKQNLNANRKHKINNADERFNYIALLSLTEETDKMYPKYQNNTIIK